MPAIIMIGLYLSAIQNPTSLTTLNPRNHNKPYNNPLCPSFEPLARKNIRTKMNPPKIEVGIIKTKSSVRKPLGGTSPKNLMNNPYTGIGKISQITDTINTHAMNLFIFIFCPLAYFDPNLCVPKLLHCCLCDALDVVVRIFQSGLYLRQQRPGLLADFVQCYNRVQPCLVCFVGQTCC